jgi:hypothetical protein
MKQERIILSFIGVLIGLLFAGIAFYLYQGTKVIPSNLQNQATGNAVNTSPTPAPNGVFLNLDTPSDEQVVTTSKVVNISGKTTADAVVLVLTKSGQQVLKPTSMGVFTTTITIDSGENVLQVVAIGPNGSTKSIQRTVSFTSESF